MYQNSCMEAAKRTTNQAELTDKGKMTDAARRAVIQNCKEALANMDEEQRSMYLNLYRERRKEKATELQAKAAASTKGADDAASRFARESSWGVGSRERTVHLAMVQGAFKQGSAFHPTRMCTTRRSSASPAATRATCLAKTSPSKGAR